jgi:hypothetical protein
MSTSPVISTAALLAAATATYYVYSGSLTNDRGSPASIVDIDDEETQEKDDEMITEDDVAQIFSRLFLEVQETVSGIMEQLQKLQMVGQRINESQVKQIMRSELERAIKVRFVELLKVSFSLC